MVVGAGALDAHLATCVILFWGLHRIFFAGGSCSSWRWTRRTSFVRF